MDDNDDRLFQNSIKYLHNISTLQEMNKPTLKSFICLKRRLMELRKSSFLPTKATIPKLHCQRCFLNFLDGPATYNVKSKEKQYKFAKKILKKQERGLPLTKYQEEYIKKVKKANENTMVITCKFCKFETKRKMEIKPKKLPKVRKQEMKKKKNKNKKDKFCGLDQNVVLSLSSSNNLKTVNDSDVIYVDPDEQQQTPKKLKMKIKTKPIETSTPLNVSINSDNKKKKNRDKNRNKLSELLQKSATKKKSSSNLIQFLQDL